ncbi:hypothetical protein DB41_GK00210 [Neochlamydia sp. TUME1]|nr:hypothetical protein DB41_GK00210 [Neochlamydia sp. TUME1]
MVSMTFFTKYKLFFVFPTLFVSFFYSLALFAEISPAREDTQGQTIQAIASLLFYIQEDIESTAQEDSPLSPLTFAPEEIEYLWARAIAFYPTLFPIKEAYEKAHYINDEGMLKRCEEEVRSIWLTLNDEPQSSAEPLNKTLAERTYNFKNISDNPLVNNKIKKELAPYLLPANSKITAIADQIFQTSRVTFNSQTLTEAGFNILYKQPRSFIIVAKHPSLPDYLIKLYFDTELRIKRNVPGWKWFARRCAGANLVRKVILKKNIQYFTVPQKYIYVLPSFHAPAKAAGVDPKVAILIVQDMQLVPKEQNYLAWRSKVTPEILNELYIIISRANGSSYRPDNIPYTLSGKFAFIDTEYPFRDPDFKSIRPYLSAEMCQYWDQLVKQGGPL